MNNPGHQKKRSYRQSARAEAAAATGERILDVFAAALRDGWFDEIRLEDVAKEANMTVQTVLRRFGSKDGLLEAVHDRIGVEIRQRREVPPGDASGAVSALLNDYEAVGDFVMRSLSQEERYTPVKAMTDIGRAMHRKWMSVAFAPWLERLPEEDRRRAVDGLVVAGDVYVWKLMRKDLKRPLNEYRALVQTMCAAALGLPHDEVFKD